MFTRRTATVTMSAPDASWARCITWNDEYLPVPTIRRDANVAVGNHQRVGIQRSSSNKIHDLDLIAVLNLRAVVVGALDDGQVVLDGHAAWVDVQLREQGGQRSAVRRPRAGRRSG